MADRIRVLHLEDNALDAELIQETLASDASREWEFVHVRAGREFEAALAAGDFDILITDHNIPGFHGREAIRLARLSDPRLPIVVVSGSMHPSDHAECRAVGATRVVLKGELKRIVEIVTDALGATGRS